MSYMVMETGKAYAVVLDGAGRFTKVANMSYGVGDVVEDVIPLNAPGKARSSGARSAVISVLAAAACAALLFFGAYRPNFVPHGTVRISINPDVLLTVSQTQRVLDLDGLNADGGALIADYEYRGKSQSTVTAELVERAAGMGYLSGGGDVNVTLDSGDTVWESEAETGIVDEIETRLDDLDITVYLSGSGDSVPRRIISAVGSAGQWQSWDDYGEFTEDMLEQWGGDTGEYIEQWGEDTGEYIRQWGEDAGGQLEESLSSGEYWMSFVENSISGVLGSLRSFFG